MLTISVLATSSAGNCTYVASESTRLLIDAGLSTAETFKRLRLIGVDPDTIDAVLVTHPHSDHMGGLTTMVRHWRRAGRVVRIYCSKSTAEGLPAHILHWDWFKQIAQYDRWMIGNIRCETVGVQHDTGEPLAFVCQVGDIRAGFFLDLGAIDQSLGQYMADCDALLLEANHDPDMLRAGPYSYNLKKRVAETHLSNESACRWIAEHMTERTRHLMLGHLSVTTNDPELVTLMASQKIKERCLSTALEVVVPGAAPTGPLVLG